MTKEEQLDKMINCTDKIIDSFDRMAIEIEKCNKNVIVLISNMAEILKKENNV